MSVDRQKSIIYHEKQVRELCALHTLNNLFQEKGFFTKAQLDEFSRQLSPDKWINPHRSMLGLGNYDINVIMTALQHKGYEAKWFDKRKAPSTIDLSTVIGFILNVPTDYRFGFISVPLKRRHWIAIKKIGAKYWNLDSKLDTPQNLGDESDVIMYLTNELESNDKELFVVRKSECNSIASTAAANLHVNLEQINTNSIENESTMSTTLNNHQTATENT